MRYIHISAISLIATISKGAHSTLISDIKSLDLSPGTQITPGSSLINFTQRWSSYDAPTYVVAVKPVTEDDVAKIVRLSFELCL
jgi:hypothetical protein